MLEEYSVTSPEPVITRSFQSPASCLALSRSLPPLAKTLVMRSSFTRGPTPSTELEQFVKHRRARVEASQKSRSLKIVKERFVTNSLEMNRVFQQSLQTALSSGSANESFEEAGDMSDVTFLRSFQQHRWETMSHFMVASASESDGSAPTSLIPPPTTAFNTPGRRNRQGLSPTMMASLVKSGLLNRQHHITSDGFQFSSQDQQSQIWASLSHYSNNAAELEMDPVDILNFLFRLGMLEMGRGYSISASPHQQQRISAELTELGIVHVNANVFYAAVELTNMASASTQVAKARSDEAQQGGTQLAALPSSAAAKSAANSLAVTQYSADSIANGFIIVETNYRLYAYTDSPLQISISNSFCSSKSRFANLVIGRFTRHSVRRALSNGIKADQIIQYLTKNQKGGGTLPPTIIDQIKLWQLELDRFRQAPGFSFRDFDSLKQYSTAVQFAQDVGALSWNNERQRMFFVDERSARTVSEFVNRKIRE